MKTNEWENHFGLATGQERKKIFRLAIFTIKSYTCHFHRHSIIIYKILKKKKIIPANTNTNVKEYDFCRV
jgi:hypothetical protein